MPVAPSQKDSPVVHYRRVAPKPQNRQCNATLSPSVVTSIANRYNHNPALVSGLEHLTAIATNSDSDSLGHVFSTRSPPILNLSPNLSAAEAQRVSPFYDLRESTRRRSLQDLGHTIQQHSPQIFSDIEEADSKASESPTRKRRKTSNSIVDLTTSPSPPADYAAWQPESHDHVRSTRSRSSVGRRLTSERHAMQPRARRSPGTRRRPPRTRPDGELYDERRAFNPPVSAAHQPHHNPILHNHPQQTSMLIDMDQVHASLPISMAPYAMPLCTAPHPLCHGTPHYPAWAMPGCRLPLGHMPACSLQHLPLPLGTNMPQAVPPIPPYHATQALPPHRAPPPQYSNHIAHHHHHHHHHPLHFIAQPPAPQLTQTNGASIDDLRLLAEQRVNYTLPPRVPRSSTLNTSPPIILQDATVHHPLPRDLYPSQEPYTSFFYGPGHQTLRNNHLHSLPPPSPPYPGFVLQFLAMLGRPPIPPYRINLTAAANNVAATNGYTEVENYEALLHLAERLGEAKPRGMSKQEIERLAAYRYNAGTHASAQTSCVVCMCDFESRQLLRVLPCDHEFHAKCVDKWLKTNRTCPICRADTMSLASQSE